MAIPVTLKNAATAAALVALRNDLGDVFYVPNRSREVFRR